MYHLWQRNKEGSKLYCQRKETYILGCIRKLIGRSQINIYEFRNEKLLDINQIIRKQKLNINRKKKNPNMPSAGEFSLKLFNYYMQKQAKTH